MDDTVERLREALDQVIITSNPGNKKETLTRAIEKALGWGHFNFVLTDAALAAMARFLTSSVSPVGEGKKE